MCGFLFFIRRNLMTYQFHTNTDPALLDEFVMNSDQNNLFQCSNWVKVKNNWGHMLTSVTDEEGKIVASALVLIRKMPLGNTLFYVPKGPVMNYNDHNLVRFMFDNLIREAKKQHAIALRFDPKVMYRRYDVKLKDQENPTMNEGVIAFLKSLGAKHKGFTKLIAETTQPRFNAEMDVDPDYYDHLDRKTIRSIETAKKKGTEVFTGHEYLKDFCTAMHYTEVRKQIALRNEEYFRNMMDVYGDEALCMVAKLNLKKQMEMLESRIAEHEEALKGELTRKQKGIHERGLAEDTAELEKLKADRETEGSDEMILCGILACFNKNMMEIFYMGNNPNAMRIRASYLLYNKCIEYCAEHGIHECSFGGMEGTLDDGLTVFKSNFLMNVEEAIGEFNFIFNKPVYWAFDKAYPYMLKTAAKIRSKE